MNTATKLICSLIIIQLLGFIYCLKKNNFNGILATSGLLKKYADFHRTGTVLTTEVRRHVSLSCILKIQKVREKSEITTTNFFTTHNIRHYDIYTIGYSQEICAKAVTE